MSPHTLFYCHVPHCVSLLQNDSLKWNYIYTLTLTIEWMVSSDICNCMCPANERWCYNVTSSLIGWAHTQNDPCCMVLQWCFGIIVLIYLLLLYHQTSTLFFKLLLYFISYFSSFLYISRDRRCIRIADSWLSLEKMPLLQANILLTLLK